MEQERDPRAHLDHDYVGQTAAAVAACLREGVPIEVNYQPGDMTSYQLVFVPLQEIRCAPGRRARSAGQVDWEPRCQFGVSRSVGCALIAWVGHGATALDLAAGHWVAGYISGLFTGSGNCEALAALFDAVAEEFS